MTGGKQRSYSGSPASFPVMAHRVVGRSSAFGELRLWHRGTSVGEGTQLSLASLIERIINPPGRQCGYSKGLRPALYWRWESAGTPFLVPGYKRAAQYPKTRQRGSQARPDAPNLGLGAATVAAWNKYLAENNKTGTGRKATTRQPMNCRNGFPSASPASGYRRSDETSQMGERARENRNVQNLLRSAWR